MALISVVVAVGTSGALTASNEAAVTANEPRAFGNVMLSGNFVVHSTS